MGGQFVSEGLIVNKAVGAGRADGLFVEALGIELATLQAGDLGADQRGAVLKILWAIRRPKLELLIMRSDRPQVLLALAGCRGIAEGGLRQRAVEVIFRRLELRKRDPQQPLCSRRGLDGGRIVASKEARLEFAGPIAELGKSQIRVSSQTALDPKRIKVRIVEGAKCRRQAAQRPD